MMKVGGGDSREMKLRHGFEKNWDQAFKRMVNPKRKLKHEVETESEELTCCTHFSLRDSTRSVTCNT